MIPECTDCTRFVITECTDCTWFVIPECTDFTRFVITECTDCTRFVIPEYPDYTWSSAGRTPSSTEQSARPYAMESGNGNFTEISKKVSQAQVNTFEWPEKRKARNFQRDLGAVSGRVRKSIPAHMREKEANLLRFVFQRNCLLSCFFTFLSDLFVFLRKGKVFNDY